MSELNKSIIKIRVDLQNAKLGKSGKNKFAGFSYYELKDVLPKLNELMMKEEVNDRYYIKDDMVILELIKGEEKQDYTMPFYKFDTPLNKQGKPSMQDIQYLGALNTYYKRYLYLNAFGITDGEVIDSMDNSTLNNQSKSNGVSPQDFMDKKDVNIENIGKSLLSKGMGILMKSGVNSDDAKKKAKTCITQTCKAFNVKFENYNWDNRKAFEDKYVEILELEKEMPF